jgi:hypothetical protein
MINLQERNRMKNRTTFIAMAAFLTMALSAGTMAQCAMHGGQKPGGPTQCAAGPAVAPEILQKFKKETKALQEQLIDKQAALQKELLKEECDPDTMANIQKAMIDIQKEMCKIAKKLGMKNCHGACPMLMGGGSMGCGGAMRGCGGK